MASLILRYAAAAAAALVAIGLLRLWRGFFWSHALLVGLAIGALVFATWRTIDRMRPRLRK